MRYTAAVLVVLVAATASATQVMSEWEKGTTLFRQGDFSAAAEQFAVVTRRLPTYASGHYMLGISLWKAGQAAEAVAPLEQAVELDRNSSPRFALALGQLLGELDRPADALAALRRVTPEALDPDDEAAYAEALAPAAAAAGALGEEVERWRGHPAVLLPLGRQLEATGQPAEAFAVYLDAAAGEFAERSLRLAFTLAMQQAEVDPDSWYPRAEQAVTALVAAEPDAADAWSWRGQLLVRREQWAEALAAFDRVRANGGDEFTVSYWRGQAAAGLGRWSDALADFDRALAAAETVDRPRVQGRRARALHELGRLPEAVAAYRAAGDDEVAAALEAALAARDSADAACRAVANELKALMRDAAEAGLKPEEVRRQTIAAHPECVDLLRAQSP